MAALEACPNMSKIPQEGVIHLLEGHLFLRPETIVFIRLILAWPLLNEAGESHSQKTASFRREPLACTWDKSRKGEARKAESTNRNLHIRSFQAASLM